MDYKELVYMTEEEEEITALILTCILIIGIVAIYFII
jgi:hypothetical protein